MEESNLEDILVKTIQGLNLKIGDMSRQLTDLNDKREDLLKELQKYRKLSTTDRAQFDRFKRMSWDKFKEDNNKNGFYIFSSNTCDLCKNYLKNVKDPFVVTQTVAVELLLDDDSEEAREMIPHFRAVPFTAYYKDNIQIDFREGELYDEQLNELKEVAKTGKPYEEKDEF